MTKADKKDIERLATRWLSHIPKDVLLPNRIQIYKSNLKGFISEFHYADVDWSKVASDNSLEIRDYFHMLIGMAETLFELHSGLGYDPESWECKVC